MATDQSNLEDLLEDLAAIEHERWVHWQKFVHSSGKIQPDGSLLVPRDLVERWERQIATNYADLADEEKESDRDQVRRYLPLIERFFGSYPGMRADG